MSAGHQSRNNVTLSEYQIHIRYSDPTLESTVYVLQTMYTEFF